MFFNSQWPSLRQGIDTSPSYATKTWNWKWSPRGKQDPTEYNDKYTWSNKLFPRPSDLTTKTISQTSDVHVCTTFNDTNCSISSHVSMACFTIIFQSQYQFHWTFAQCTLLLWHSIPIFLMPICLYQEVWIDGHKTRTWQNIQTSIQCQITWRIATFYMLMFVLEL